MAYRRKPQIGVVLFTFMLFHSRWRLFIHGGIDGYSRMIVYLRCADNNHAVTVLQLFQAATEEFGIPSRVRAEWGVGSL